MCLSTVMYLSRFLTETQSSERTVKKKTRICTGGMTERKIERPLQIKAQLKFSGRKLSKTWLTNRGLNWQLRARLVSQCLKYEWSIAEIILLRALHSLYSTQMIFEYQLLCCAAFPAIFHRANSSLKFFSMSVGCTSNNLWRARTSLVDSTQLNQYRYKAWTWTWNSYYIYCNDPIWASKVITRS